MIALLAAGMLRIAYAGDEPANGLSTLAIFKKTQETYDSLTSYSDKGKTISISKSDGRDITIITEFTTKLARPNLYRIEWKTTDDIAQTIRKSSGAVWSAGEDNFWDVGSGPQKQKNRDRLLMTYDGSSGGAIETIPGAFFKMHWANHLADLGLNQTREADEKVGDIGCYVFLREFHDGKQKITLWIGKQDFLIHQIRRVTPDIEPNFFITATETHADIVVNQKYSPADFAQ